MGQCTLSSSSSYRPMFVKCLFFTERLRCAGAKGIYSHHYSALGDVLFVSTSGRYVRQAINQQVLFAAIRYASMPFTFILLSRFSTPQPKHCRDIPESLIKKSTPIHAVGKMFSDCRDSSLPVNFS